MRRLAVLLSILLLLFVSAICCISRTQAEAQGKKFSLGTFKGPSGTIYTFFYQADSQLDFEVNRPSATDKSILLCIPAAFTAWDGAIDGLYICKGNVGNRDKRDTRIGGAIEIVDGKCRIFPAPGGNVHDDDINRIVAKKGSLFQQFQMVVDGKPERFRDTSLFQRRGICTSKDGRAAIVESNQAITLNTFAEDVSHLGAYQLLYTDMGIWDEGWYRRPADGKVITIGLDRSNTQKQTNWVVLRQPHPQPGIHQSVK